MHADASKNVNFATCPACGLLCDDLPVNHRQDVPSSPGLDPSFTKCAQAITFFNPQPAGAKPAIANKTVSLVEAVAHAAKLLKQAKNPVIAGLSTDVTGFRAAYQLAQHIHATMVHMHAESTARNTRVLQSTGWQTTTLTEVKNRADMLVLIGTDAVSHNPRFFERFVWTDAAMFTDATARDIVYLGGKHADTSAGNSPSGKSAQVLPCANVDLPDVVAGLHALVLGKKLVAEQIGGIATTQLEQLAARLKAAQYAVLIWNAKALDFAHAELTIEHITATVASLNEATRAAGLALGGSDGDTTVNYAHAWLSGLTLAPLALETCDTLIWINSFSPQKRHPAGQHAVIALGHADTVFETAPDVFIPIATPGLECGGALFRVDSSVVVPLQKTRAQNLPTLAEVLGQIEGLCQ